MEEKENLPVFSVVFKFLQQGSAAVTVGESVFIRGGVEWSDVTSEVPVIRIQMKVFQTVI